MNINFSDISSRISKSFDQAKQYASEKIGTAEDLTAYPSEFLQLQDKFDKLKIVHDNLIRINKQLVTADDYSPALQEQMKDVMAKLNETLVSHTGGSASPLSTSHSISEASTIPKDIYSAASQVASDASRVLVPADDLNEALTKYAYAMEKLSIFKAEMNDSVTAKFLNPMRDMMDVLFVQANEARKILSTKRLSLDAIKSKCKGTGSDRMSSMQNELAESEKAFKTALEDATRRMKAVCENPLVIQHVSDLVEAQRKFHKQSYEVLNGVIII